MGSITPQVADGQLPVCSAFGSGFFVKDPRLSEGVLVPAWSVANEQAVVKQKLEANCKVLSKTLQFTFSYPDAGRGMQVITTPIKLFYLQIDQTALQKQKLEKKVQLIRPMIRDMTTSSAKKAPTVSKATKMNRPEMSPLWAECKHVFK